MSSCEFLELNFSVTAGNMFGIRAEVEGVKINSFAFQTLISGRTTSVHVYRLTALGNVYGNESFLNNPAAWTRLSPTGGIQVQARGFGNPTIIPAGSFAPISIAKGSIQSIYISLIEETEMLYKAVDETHPTGAVYASDSNVSVMTGVGKGISFGQNWQSRQMNGAVFYSVGGNDSIEATTPDPTPNPTRPPTKQPTNRLQSPVLTQLSELETTYNANKKQVCNFCSRSFRENESVSFTHDFYHFDFIQGGQYVQHHREEKCRDTIFQNPHTLEEYLHCNTLHENWEMAES